MVSELLGMDEPRKRIAAMISGLDIKYDLGEGHLLLGRRLPDLDLVTSKGPLRTFTLLHNARPVLLNLRSPATSISRNGLIGSNSSMPNILMPNISMRGSFP